MLLRWFWKIRRDYLQFPCVRVFSHVRLFASLASFLCPWDFPGKNTGVGCHFLLQGIHPKFPIWTNYDVYLYMCSTLNHWCSVYISCQALAQGCSLGYPWLIQRLTVNHAWTPAGETTKGFTSWQNKLNPEKKHYLRSNDQPRNW